MPLINFKAIEEALAPQQKRELIEKLTDATAAGYGEGIRQVTRVVIEDVTSLLAL
jgi:4-oxalocrotonate tautomerase